MRMTLLL